MKRVLLQDAQLGEVLAQDLRRNDGVLLAGKGTALSEGLLKTLARMNIDTVIVEGDESLSFEEIEEIYTSRVKDLNLRFVKVEKQVPLAALKAALINLAKEQRDSALSALPPADEAEGGGETEKG